MSVFKFQSYDLVVCGAGPAGLMAACTFAKQTGDARRVLLLDKKDPWKEPIFCAEAVSKDRLEKLWPIDPSWVRGRISGIYFTSPKGYRAEFYSKDCGLLLNRSLFHHALADGCAAAGVECAFDTLVKGLSRNDDGTWTLTVQGKEGENVTLVASAVIDATGPGSRLTRGVECLDGIESGDADLEPAVFALAEGIEHSPEHIELFFGSEFPGGYGWIFPRDGVEVNIGFVLGKNERLGISLRQKLNEFIEKHYPQARIKAIYGGMIACSGSTPKPLARCGLFKAGDAASCVNPISRSGIVEALLCGKIVVEWLDAAPGEARESVEAKALDRWMEALGRSHLQIARAKPGFNSIADKQFDRAAGNLSKLPREKQTLFRIFFSVLWACPSLIWKMRSFLH